MERKTKIMAEDGRQDLLITREFDLPVYLLFKAYADAGIVAQWMSTKVLQLESRPNGAYHYQTSDPEGNIVFEGHGVIHEFVENEKITRTFEMKNAGFDVQLEFLRFEALDEERSSLNIHMIFRSGELRDRQLKLPFSYGINMAHDRLQEVLQQLK